MTNLYRFFNTLLEEVDGLKIDNCASGGKRIDIEMTGEELMTSGKEITINDTPKAVIMLYKVK